MPTDSRLVKKTETRQHREALQNAGSYGLSIQTQNATRLREYVRFIRHIRATRHPADEKRSLRCWRFLDPNHLRADTVQVNTSPALLTSRIMVCLAEAAELCGMSPETYRKYAGKRLLPPMNATGRVSVKAVERAALKLDGIDDVDAGRPPDEAERALQEWKRSRS
jgi:hypothetical protein